LKIRSVEDPSGLVMLRVTPEHISRSVIAAKRAMPHEHVVMPILKDRGQNDTFGVTAPWPECAGSNQVIFIDLTAPGYQALLTRLAAGTRLYVLGPNQPGPRGMVDIIKYAALGTNSRHGAVIAAQMATESPSFAPA
jgi:hypothetical protein